MPPTPEPTRERLKTRLIGAYISLCHKKPAVVLLVLGLVTLLFGALATRIQVDGRLEALLPPDTATSRANDEARERFAAANPFYMVIESPDPEYNWELSERVTEAVKKWPETIVAVNRRDPSYFLDRRLLYVDEETLTEFADEIEAYKDWHSCENTPGCSNLEDEPPEPDFDRLREYYRTLPELQSLASLFGKDTIPDPEAGARAGEGNDANGAAAPPGALCGRGGKVCVIQVTLNRPPSDLDFASRMRERGESLLRELSAASAPKGLLTAVTGIYRNLPMTRDAVMSDLAKTFLVSLGLVVLVLAFQFRKARAIVLLLVPMLAGSVWALGMFGVISPVLNIISAAVLVILAGLGIDFGLHLITHYGARREVGSTPAIALIESLDELLSPLLVAALTTGCGFLALTAAQFRGFAQMGLLAAVGVLCTLLAALLVVPPLVLLLQRRFPIDGSVTRSWRLPEALSRAWKFRPAVLVGVLGLVVLAVAVDGVRHIQTLDDLSSLLAKSVGSHGTHYGDALHGTNRSSVLMMADDPEALEEAARGIRERFPHGLRGNEDNVTVITPGTFVPPDQEARLEVIRRLETLAKSSEKHAEGDLAERIEAWKPLLAVREPISIPQMPRWVFDSFAETDRTFGTIGVLYQNYSSIRTDQMTELAQKLDQLRGLFPKVRFSSSNAVLGEVMPLLSADGYLVTGLALIGLVIGTLLVGRSLRRTLLVVGAIVLAVTVTAGCMVLFGWKVNFYNMLVFPVAFGIGVDGAIYVVWTVYRRQGRFEFDHLPVTWRAVLGSTLTTLVAFGSLSVSENGGLRSLGQLAATSLGITLFVNLFWLPAVLSLLARRASSPS